MKLSTLQSKSILRSAVMVALFVCYTVLRLGSLSQAMQKPRSTTDTQAYLRISGEPLLSADFLSGSRPLGFPLILKLFAGNKTAVAWAQGILSTLSWATLALFASRATRVKAFAPIVFAGMLLLSLYQKIIGWDATMLTESLSLSLTALVLAAWLWLAEGWHSYKILALVLIAFFWAFTRDTNAWVLLMIAVVMLSLVLIRRLENKYLFPAAAFIGIFLLSNLSSEIGERWVFPFNNIMAGRILVSEAAVEYFASCEMPVTPALMQLAAGFAGSNERAFSLAPELEGYRAWLNERGKLCYVGWLLSDPLRSVSQPLSDAETLLTLGQVDSFFFSKRFLPILPMRLESILYPRRWTLIILLVTNLAALFILVSGLWKKNPSWPVCGVLCLLVFPHIFLVWHGDTIGIYRHALLAGVQFYLGVWLMLILTCEAMMRSLVPDKP